MRKEPLFGKNLYELQTLSSNLGLPSYTGAQLAGWLYKKNALSIDEMTNLSKDARKLLNENYSFGVYLPSKVQESIDGSKKYLFDIQNKLSVETVYLPEEKRSTLCISSQAGCKMGCLFCMTGRQGFQAQLTAGEILNQIRSIPESNELSNVVYMGMGEPFDNIDEVLKSIEILTSDWGYEWSPRRITVSTIGIIPSMRRFIEESEAHLAISIHTPFSAERLKLMPIEKTYPIKKVVELLKEYDFGKQRRISFEYIMFEGFNDTTEHIKGLTKLLKGLRCRINLIKFHNIPDFPFNSASQKKMLWFCDQLKRKGLNCTIRRSRGEDIYAACGLLSTMKNEK